MTNKIFDLIKNKQFDELLVFIKDDKSLDLDIYDNNNNYPNTSILPGITKR